MILIEYYLNIVSGGAACWDPPVLWRCSSPAVLFRGSARGRGTCSVSVMGDGLRCRPAVRRNTRAGTRLVVPPRLCTALPFLHCASARSSALFLASPFESAPSEPAGVSRGRRPPPASLSAPFHKAIFCLLCAAAEERCSPTSPLDDAPINLGPSESKAVFYK